MKMKPRISVNKLMEYMDALPSRQREIVDNQKNPLANKPKITWCANARRKIIEYFAGGCADESILDNEIERLQGIIESLDEKDPRKLESKIKKIQVDIDAINSFKGLQEKLDLQGVKYSKASNKPKYLDYSGVHVSVRPEILVMEKTWEHIGCLKLYLTKSHRLEESAADFLCAVLNHYADKYLAATHLANPKACIVIDVFGQKVFRASKNVSLHAGKIRKSCQEIREMWPTIPERMPIDGKDDDGQLNFPE